MRGELLEFLNGEGIRNLFDLQLVHGPVRQPRPPPPSSSHDSPSECQSTPQDLISGIVLAGHITFVLTRLRRHPPTHRCLLTPNRARRQEELELMQKAKDGGLPLLARRAVRIAGRFDRPDLERSDWRLRQAVPATWTILQQDGPNRLEFW